MKAISGKSFLYVGLLSLLALPSCEFLKDKVCCSCSCKKDVGAKIDKDDKSEVLLKIKGEPVVTANMFEEYFNNFLEANPRMKQVLPFIPDAEKSIFA